MCIRDRIRTLLYNGKSVEGTQLLYSSLAIWATNIIVFGLWYWEIDRGGPDDRLEADHGPPDFLYPQMTAPGCTYEGWSPRFLDYLYVAFTNATAFSPTDTMPLTPMAKVLMIDVYKRQVVGDRAAHHGGVLRRGPVVGGQNARLQRGVDLL